MSTMSQPTETAPPPPPPPSPIPTGKGSRSASNEPFARFLDLSLQVPALSLPETGTRRLIPAEVDLRSLVSGAGDSVDRILRSAKDFAAFRIVGHGISVDELRSLLIGERERVFRKSEKERMLWISICSPKEGPESTTGVIANGSGRYPELSAKMEHVASKLEAIAQKLNQILLENAGKKLADEQKKKNIFEENESILSLYRFKNNQSSMEQNQLPLNDEIESKLCDHSLSLHLPFEHCQIHVQSEMQHLAFEAGPETLFVTHGKQLQVRSLHEFKCFSGKMMFLPTDIRESPDYFFSMELRFSSSNSKNVLHRDCKTISILDQVVIAITITLLYKVFMFLTSHIFGA